MNTNQRIFVDRLILIAKAELHEARRVGNTERIDILTARIKAYEATLEEKDD